MMIQQYALQEIRLTIVQPLVLFKTEGITPANSQVKVETPNFLYNIEGLDDSPSDYLRNYIQTQCQLQSGLSI